MIRPKGHVPFSFLHSATTTDAFVERIALVAKGAAYPATSFDDFEKSPLLIPDDELLKQFHAHCEPLMRIKNVLLVKTQQLRQSRNLLLGRLVSGTFPVEDRELTSFDAKDVGLNQEKELAHA